MYFLKNYKVIYCIILIISSVSLSFTVTSSNAQTNDKIKKAYGNYYSKNWDEAIEIFSKLAKENPYNPQYIVRLAISQQNAGKYEESTESFLKALETGNWPDIYLYNIAVNYARIGNTPKAIEYLEKSIESGWPDYRQLESDEDFALLHSNEEFLKLLGKSKDKLSRDEMWLEDLDFMYEKLKILHYDIYNKNAQGVWESHYDQIKKNIPAWDDDEIIVNFMKFAALAGEGHTKVLPPSNSDSAFRSIPIQIYHFKDGTYITASTKPNEGTAGMRILSIGGVSIEELYKKSYYYAGHENIFHHKKFSPRLLVTQEILIDMGVEFDNNNVILVLEDESGKKSEHLFKTISRDSLENLNQEDWVYASSSTGKPFYLQVSDDIDYEAKFDTSKSITHIKINYILNGKLKFTDFIRETLGKYDELKSDILVLDLRNCGGGNSALNKYLIEEILKREIPEGSFYTIIGRETYSAAINLVTDLEYRTNTIFIGEPTGSSPNFIGESNALRLPNSQLYLIISNRYHQGGSNNSLDMRPWIAPDILIELTSSEFKANRDPVMENIYSMENK